MSSSNPNTSTPNTTTHTTTAPKAKTRKNALGNRTDIGWKYGTDVLGNGKKVKCNYCYKVVSGGISRFKHHLGGTKEDSEPCASVPEEVKLLCLKVIAEAKEAALKKRKLIDLEEEEEEDGEETQNVEVDSSQRKEKSIISTFAKGKGKIGYGSSNAVQKTINQVMKKDFKEEIDLQFAKYMYTSAIPFNTIKNVELEKLCDMIGRYGVGYKPPSYHDVREKLLKKTVDEVNIFLEDYKKEWKRTGCSIMSDGWTDKKRRSICNFLVNSPKGTVFLYSLDTSDISKTTDMVYKMLDDVVNYVGEENVVQVVTDNATNFKAAGEKLMETRKNLYWTPCVAHCIDLIFEDFEKKLKVHQSVIKKGRKICTYIYTKTRLISMMKKFTEGRDLIRPGVTRFATAYLTLSCLNDNKGALLSMFASETWTTSKYASTREGKDVQRTALDSRFWGNIITCLKAVSPLITVLRLVDADEKPAMGFIYQAMDKAMEGIKSNFNNAKKK